MKLTKAHRFLDKIPKRVVMTILVFLVNAQCQFFKGVEMTAIRTILEPEFVANEHMADAHRKKINQTICGQLQREPSPPPYKDSRNLDYKWKHSYYSEVNKYFFLGFAASCLPGGLLADMLGGKHVVTGALALGTVSTLVSPVVIHLTNGLLLVLQILRFITGMVVGVLGPAGYSVLAHWVPANERGRLCGTALNGVNIAITIYFPLTGWSIKQSKNYGTPFYIYGSTGALLILAWHFIATSHPYEKKNLTTNEKLYLNTEMGNSVDHRRKKKVPIFKMLLSLDVWAYVLPAGMYLWSWNLYIFMMQIYMVNVLRRSSIVDRPGMTALFAISALVGLLSSFVTDCALNTRTISRTTIRKVFTTLGLVGPAIFLLAGSYTYCNIKLAGTMFVISGTLCGFVIAGVLLVPYDMAPNFSGTLSAGGATFGLVFGLLVDKFVFKAMEDKTLVQYRSVFWIVLGACAICNSVFTVIGNADEKGWNKTRPRMGRRASKAY